MRLTGKGYTAVLAAASVSIARCEEPVSCSDHPGRRVLRGRWKRPMHLFRRTGDGRRRLILVLRTVATTMQIVSRLRKLRAGEGFLLQSGSIIVLSSTRNSQRGWLPPPQQHPPLRRPRPAPHHLLHRLSHHQSDRAYMCPGACIELSYL